MMSRKLRCYDSVILGLDLRLIYLFLVEVNCKLIDFKLVVMIDIF
jgi:hypothetical protein